MEMNLENLKIVYTPTDEDIFNSNIYRILKEENINYQEFYEKSVKDEDWFWKRFFNDIQFKWFKYPDRIVEKNGLNTRWFLGGILNISSNCLDAPKEKIAVIDVDENLNEVIISYGQLEITVNKLANFLANNGIGIGDRVALYMPLCYESVVCFLAIARIGAIVVPLFSGFGKDSINIRLRASKSKMVIAFTSNLRRNKLIDMKNVLFSAIDDTCVEKILFIDKYGDYGKYHKQDKVKIYYYNEIEGCASNIKVPYFNSDHPLMIIYTSGTTGLPKGILHFHSGFPIKASQDMFHVFDIKEDDVITWITDIGWMMGPWLIYGTLINRATIFIYNGSPDYPDVDIIWKLVEKYGVTCVGLSPSYVRAISTRSQIEKMELNSLRMVGSTGEVWDEHHWNWVFQKVCKKKKPIINYSGGTEISGGILGNVIIKPIKPLSFNTVVPGIEADIFDDSGKSVRSEVGYLCVKNHNPGMATTFLDDHQRYIDTYWSKFENVWFHGDLAYVDKDDFYYILGRADDTLKIAGKRIGPAEYETIINDIEGVRESAVVGVPDELKGMVPVAFVVIDGHSEEDIKKQILSKIIEMLGKPFALKDVFFVEDLPKTRNFKIMRRILRDIVVYGYIKGDTSNLVNPEVCEKITNKVKRVSL
ncbi:MAG: AMP-binding protein [Candidatus Calescibacterium sp.]|nr:AMP-binding protein [Candidatus Calescibacterium sp.]MCX7758913.1 AMP-binding protein [bacterium]